MPLTAAHRGRAASRNSSTSSVVAPFRRGRRSAGRPRWPRRRASSASPRPALPATGQHHCRRAIAASGWRPLPAMSRRAAVDRLEQAERTVVRTASQAADETPSDRRWPPPRRRGCRQTGFSDEDVKAGRSVRGKRASRPGRARGDLGKSPAHLLDDLPPRRLVSARSPCRRWSAGGAARRPAQGEPNDALDLGAGVAQRVDRLSSCTWHAGSPK